MLVVGRLCGNCRGLRGIGEQRFGRFGGLWKLRARAAGLRLTVEAASKGGDRRESHA